MELTAMAAAVATISENHSILIYGPPKSGKTRLVATAAKLPEIRRIYWFDLENGVETLLNMGLTPEEMAKIVVFKLPDTRENPVGIETMLKVFSSRTPVKICDAHGVVGCVECTRAGASTSSICLRDCKHDELVVIDSGSQLGDSSLNGACKGQDVTYKLQLDDYGTSGKWLADILSVVQQAQWTNFVVITHELVDEEEINGVKKDRIFPLMGTKTFCRKVAKYFGTVAYTHMKLGKHAAGSGSTYKADTLTGSRVNALLEKAKEPSMRDILIEGGVLKKVDNESALNSVVGSMVANAVQTVTAAEKPVSPFAARLAASRNK